MNIATNLNKYALITSLLLFLSWAEIAAQVPANPIGINPPGLKWRQIDTDRVQVIFPEGLDSAGQRVANIVHYLWDHHNRSIGEQMTPVTILLQNQPVISNGFVTPGPFRSEFYTIAPQFNCTTDWLDILAIHEYRHVKQFGNSKKGLTNVVRSVLGSWPWGGMYGLALPRWYFEGDATMMETALTRSGRGRLPAFDMEYRTLSLEGVKFSYEKAGARSLKEFVPNWYRLGYYMTTYARRQFGQDIWAGALEDAVRYRGLFYSFSKSLKNSTGLNTRELYQATMADLDELWAPELEERKKAVTDSRTINGAPRRTVVHYNNPHYLDDGKILVEKRGYDRIPAYFAIGPDGTETKITSPGALFSEPETTLSYAAGRLCWAELGFDERWSNRTFSIIKTYDLATGTKHKVSSRTRLFSPDLSEDGQRIVAVETETDMSFALVVLHAETGEVIRRIPNPEGYFLAYPRWTDDGSGIVVAANKNEESSLLLVNPTDGKSRILTPPTIHQITHPYPHGDQVFFSSAYTGTNNIFRVSLETGEIHQLTDVLTGAFQPSVSKDNERLLFSEFSLDGYNIKELELKDALWAPYAPAEAPFSIDYFEPIVEQEGGESIIGKIPDQEYPVKKFNKWSGIINPHSLLPYISHPIYGLQLLSDNKFSTLSASGGGFYNVNENEWSFFADLSYAELFPVINARYRRSNRSGLFFNFSEVSADSTVILTTYGEEWAENSFGGGVAIPLNFSAGNAITRLNLRADYQYIDLKTDNGFERENNRRDTLKLGNPQGFEPFILPPITDGGFSAVDLNFSFFSIRRRALQHLNTRLGFNVGLRYRATLDNEAFQAENILTRFDLFLPGIGRNHSFYLNTMYQRQDILDNYRFSDVFVYPRGYDSQIGNNFYKIGINYSFPITYPDWAIGPVAFLKRIKANIFYDIGWTQFGDPFANNRSDMSSLGIELGFDFRLFRILEIDAGVRYSYLLSPDRGPNGNSSQFDFFVISISE